MSRYESKLNAASIDAGAKSICIGCKNSCAVTSCKGTCTLTCKGTGSSRPAVKKENS